MNQSYRFLPLIKFAKEKCHLEVYLCVYLERVYNIFSLFLRLVHFFLHIPINFGFIIIASRTIPKKLNSNDVLITLAIKYSNANTKT